MALVSEEVDLVTSNSKDRSNDTSNDGSKNGSNAAWNRRLVNVATDPHFWLPTIVLAAGLMLLRWVR
jgi:hypothetical protein